MTSKKIEQFRTVPEKIAALQKALSNPHVQEALQLINLANIPTPTDAIPDVLVSRRYHEMMGIHTAIRTLRSMATPATEKEDLEPIPDDFTDDIDPELLKP